MIRLYSKDLNKLKTGDKIKIIRYFDNNCKDETIFNVVDNNLTSVDNSITLTIDGLSFNMGFYDIEVYLIDDKYNRYANKNKTISLPQQEKLKVKEYNYYDRCKCGGE